MTIQDLLDLSKTIAAPLFAGKTYPWEALAEIGDFILQLGPTLPAEEYEQRGEPAQAHAAHEGNPERHEQVEPEQDDEEIELVFRTAEEEQPTEVER